MRLPAGVHRASPKIGVHEQQDQDTVGDEQRHVQLAMDRRTAKDQTEADDAAGRDHRLRAVASPPGARANLAPNGLEIRHER